MQTEITAQTQYLVETLYTDTVVWEIVDRTEKTLTIRSTRDGAVVSRDTSSGSPYPVVHIEALPDPNGRTRVVRLRKDGTYRVGGGSALRAVKNSVALRRVDYRY